MNIEKIKKAHSKIKTTPITFTVCGKSVTVYVREGKDINEVIEKYKIKYAI